VTYGVGDGSTTFNVPDFAGVFPRGAGTSTKLTNANSTAFAGTLGTYQNDKMQGHYHSIERTTGGSGYFYNQNLVGGASYSTALTFYRVRAPITDGTNGTPRTGAETNPANLSINFMIKI